jgi:two-component system sensor histidine kinase YesM
MKKFGFEINSIFSRLFLSFLLIITPMIIVGVVIFSWEEQTIRMEIKNSASANVSFLKKNLESEVDNILTLQYNMENDQTLRKLANNGYNSQYEYYTVIGDLQQRLMVMKTSNTYIENITVYFPDIQQVVSVNDGYMPLETDEYNQVMESCMASKYPIIIDGSNICSLVTFPPKTDKSEQPLYLINVQLSKSKISDLLASSNGYKESDTALFDCTSKNWLFSSLNRLNVVDKKALMAETDSTCSDTSRIVNVGRKKYYIISSFSKTLNFSVLVYVPLQDIFHLTDIYKYFLYLFAFLSLVIVAAYSFSTYYFVKSPVNKIVDSFKSLEEGNLGVRIQFRAANEFNYLYEEFNKMVSCLNTLIDNVYKQQIYAQKAELKQLQTQINPHFLYNSYFMLDRMIKVGDIENARALSSHLGKYFRFITRNTAEEVTLSQEVEHANSYAQIQQMRFSKQMSVEFGDIPEQYRNVMVPRMILQPLLENAIEYGLKDTDKDGLLRVAFSDKGDGLEIAVEDSGKNLIDSDIESLRQKLSPGNDNTEVTAILNIHRRLVLRYGAGSGISVSRSELGGLNVKIKIVPDTSKMK